MKQVSSSPVASPVDPAAQTVDVDRSQEILGVMHKEARDQLTCARVFDDFYRCNWWAPGDLPGRGGPMIHGLEVSTYRVRKSQFVKATMSQGKLLVEDATFSKG